MSSKSGHANKKTSKPYHLKGEPKAERPKQAEQKGLVAELPVLRFKSNMNDNNFVEFKEALSAYALREYGDLGRMIEDLEYFDIPEVEVPDDDSLSPQNDPHGFRALQIRNLMTDRTKRMSRMESQKTQLYSVIWNQLSLESKAKVQESEHFGNTETAKDPLRLWLLVCETHLVGRETHKIVNYKNLRDQYNKLRQQSTMSLYEYYKLFTDTLTKFDFLDKPRPDYQDQAIDFIKGLDRNRYAAFIADLENSTNAYGILNYPENLLAAYTMASNFQVVRAVTSGSNANAVFLSSADYAPKNKAKNNKKNSEWTKSDQRKSEKKSNHSGEMKSHKKPPSPCEICAGDHWNRDCPMLAKCKKHLDKKKSNKAKETVVVAVEDQESDYESDTCFTLIEAQTILASSSTKLCKHDVLLDNQATTSIFREASLLSNIREGDYSLVIQGIGGCEVKTNLIGDFGAFGPVNYCPDAIANVLSFAEVKDNHRVLWDNEDDAFTVETDAGQSITFCRNGKLYSCNMKKHTMESVCVTTVEDNESKFTRREVIAARLARDVAKELAYPSDQDLIAAIQSGAINNLPITARDVQRAREIYGTCIPSLKGKTVARKSTIAEHDKIVKTVRQVQQLHVDIMYVEGDPYLISISAPLGLMIASDLPNRTADSVKERLNTHLARYRSEGFEIATIFCDGEGAVARLITGLNLAGVRVNIAGPGQHVPVIERCIRMIKERIRCIVTTLPYRLPKQLVKYLVFYCVSRVNMLPRSTSVDRTSPREAFTGRKTDYRRDIRIGFGEYVQAHVPADKVARNSNKPRTEGAIALYPTGNLQGSVRFFSLATGKVITRDNWNRLPVPQEVVQHMNSLAAQSPTTVALLVPNTDVARADDLHNIPHTLPVEPIHDGTHTGITPAVADQLAETTDQLSADSPTSATTTIADTHDTAACIPPTTSVLDTIADEATEEAANAPEVSRDRQNDADVSITAVDETPSATLPTSDRDTAAPDTQSAAPLPSGRYNLRTRPSREERNQQLAERKEYGLHISVKKALNTFGEKAVSSIMDELDQMLTKEVFYPVDVNELSVQQKKTIIRSSLFLKEKYLSNGEFDKLKARLVAGGHMQLRDESDDNSSPTVSTSSVFITAAIAAREARSVSTVDIGGAYLNAPMGDTEVFMKLDKLLSSILVRLNGDYQSYLSEKGELVVKLNKALYGCIQSAKLWYKHLRSTLETMGFAVNSCDECVFNRGVGDGQCTICVHVDDLLITCANQSTIEAVIHDLTNAYKELKVNSGNKHSYLGMSFDFSAPGRATISMEGFTDDLLKYYNVSKKASSPASAHLFEIRESPRLEPADAKLFHSAVAKLLYLAKRTRPELLTLCSFLASRVTCSTEDDMKKLERGLAYLNADPHLGIALEIGADIVINAYVDAAYGVHADYKSHTGGVICIGAGPTFVVSSKQKLVAKSSTEAELIALSDMSSQVIWVRDFLLAQGHHIKSTILHEDNLSTITMVKKGKSKNKGSKHINIRYYFVKDRIESGELSIQYLSTLEMLADCLTKPLQGSHFRRLRDKLLNTAKIVL